MPILSAERICVTYGSGLALNGVTFSVPAGSSTAVIGLNGAGKSSLARVLSGLVKPCGGTVRIDGQDVTARPASQIRRLGVSYIPEGRGVYPSLTVADNLRMATRWVSSRSARRAAISNAFELFPILADRKQQQAGTLSGGEQQMLALARGLATPPRVLIADELSLGLAPKIVDEVFEHLNNARASGVTVVLIEQFVHRALDFADQLLVLRRGEMAWSGPSSELSYDAIVDRYMGERQESGTASSPMAGAGSREPAADRSELDDTAVATVRRDDLSTRKEMR
jgi:branched-chain amino acid transport system ATP-binding protein